MLIRHTTGFALSLVSTLGLGCTPDDHFESQASALTSAAQVLSQVEPGAPRLPMLASDRTGTPELSSTLLLGDLQSINVRWRTLPDYPDGTTRWDGTWADASGFAVERWRDQSSAPHNAESGYVSYEPATDALHFAGYPDDRTDAPFVYRRHALVDDMVTTTTSTLFQVKGSRHAEKRALPAVSVDEGGMLHMAAVFDDGVTWMGCAPASPGDCSSNAELVAPTTESVYAVALTASASPVISWLRQEGVGFVVETRLRDANGQWKDVGATPLPSDVRARFSTEPILQLHQGHGRLLMLVRAANPIASVSDGGQALIYELRTGGWSLVKHLRHPYAKNWARAEPLGWDQLSMQLRLSPDGFVVLTSTCVALDDDEDECEATRWRWYREDTGASYEHQATTLTAGVDGLVYTLPAPNDPATPVTGEQVPDDITYPKLPTGTVRLSSYTTMVFADMVRTYDSIDNWPEYRAQGNAQVSCDLFGENPGLLRLSCIAWSPTFNASPTYELPTTCEKDIGTTPSQVTCDNEDGYWRGIVDVDADGAHFNLTSLVWRVSEGSTLTQTVAVPARVSLRP